MTRLLAALVLLTLAGAGSARAQSHAVTVRNGAGDTITGIHFNGAGESRLRRPLPPGAEARITYSTGCRADVHVSYAGGRSEDFPAVDVCSDPRLVAGGGEGGGPVSGGGAGGAQAGQAPRAATVAAGPGAAAKNVVPAKAPPPEVPPWTGKSITKRFGGLD